MKKYFSEYIDSLEKLLETVDALSDDELSAVRRELLIKIGFMQHERLIHFLVTMLFAVVFFISLGVYLILGGLLLLPLLALLLSLLVPYIAHYYFLENGVQRLYSIYDRLCRNGIPNETD